MPQEAEQQKAQQFEQIIGTVFACRSVIKYNLGLSEGQKQELLNDIDSALDVLRTHMLSSQVGQSKTAPPVELSPVVSSTKIPLENASQHTLQSLYRMYYVFLDTNHSTNINSFIVRFNEVMDTISQVQRTMEQQHGGYNAYPREVDKDPLQQVCVFVADLYYIFMEFLRVLSDVLQQHQVQLDTEKLLYREEQVTMNLPTERRTENNELMPLLGAYRAHQQINEQRGQLTARISNTTMFIEQLKESQFGSANTQTETIQQLNNVNRLLYDLSIILTDYEKATSLIIPLSK